MNQNIKIIMITIIGTVLVYGSLILYYDKQDEIVQIANPASVHCLENDGQLEFSDDNIMCILPDGTIIEEWEFYRS